MKNKKCVITGGSGFVGTHLAKRLLELKNDVKIIDLEKPEQSIKSEVEFDNVDIRNFDEVKKACKDADFIFHTVALVPISKADDLFEEVNVGGTENILKAASQENVQSVVHMSSTAVYKIPNRGDIMNENYPIEPVAAYGKAKYQSEKICFKYMKKNLPISIIRPKTVLGPNRLGIYSLLFDWIMHNNPIFIFGDGQNKYSYISISDLVEAMIQSATKGIGEIFNIATDNYGTYKGDITDLIEYVGSKSKIICINATTLRIILKILDRLKLSPFSEWHYSVIDKEYVFDISKAKQILGWTPKDSNQKMFRESYNWFKENYDIIKKVGTTHRTKLDPKIFKIISRLH